jgi:hypothetical protein
MHAAVSAIVWSSAQEAVAFRQTLPIHTLGWERAESTASGLADAFRFVAQGTELDLVSSAFAWSGAASLSESGKGDPHILRPRAAPALSTPAKRLEMSAQLRTRLVALADDAPAFAAAVADGMEAAHAERMRVRRAARRHNLGLHGQPMPTEAGSGG